MTRTLDSFNTEWYELQAKGRLGEEYTTKVPDIYLRNEELDEQVSFFLCSQGYIPLLDSEYTAMHYPVYITDVTVARQ